MQHNFIKYFRILTEYVTKWKRKILVKPIGHVNFKCDVALLEEINDLVRSPYHPGGTFNNFSEAVRECIKIGIQVHRYKEVMEDPTKSKEFIKKMQKMVEDEQMDSWYLTLTSQQKDGFIAYMQLKKKED